MKEREEGQSSGEGGGGLRERVGNVPGAYDDSWCERSCFLLTYLGDSACGNIMSVRHVALIPSCTFV